MPASDASVVSAMSCTRTPTAAESANTATPTEMSARFGSFRRTSRKTDDRA